jgi:probable F420-dependent oxidoreductase
MSDYSAKSVGIWVGVRPDSAAEWAASDEGARAIEQLGYGELWIPGGFSGRLAPTYDEALGATASLPVASGILSIYHSDPSEAAAKTAALNAASGGRFTLGLGTSHAPAVERAGLAYDKPYTTMVRYLDALDAAEHPVPREHLMLAALGPRMLELAAERTAGAHPYFVPVEHTSYARGIVGDGPRIATEIAVVLESDPAAARALARTHTRTYLTLPNYTNNLRRMGWGDDDLAGEGSDALVDAIVAWGDPDRIAERVRAHHDAGADSVLLQVLVADPTVSRAQAYRDLAAVLIR